MRPVGTRPEHRVQDRRTLFCYTRPITLCSRVVTSWMILLVDWLLHRLQVSMPAGRIDRSLVYGRLARRVLKTKPCNSSSLDDFVVTELRLERPRRGKQPRDLRAISTVEELPRYVAEVLQAVADGIQTTRAFAARQNVSIGAARERFRVTYQLGWIARADDEHHPSTGFRYMLRNAPWQKSLF